MKNTIISALFLITMAIIITLFMPLMPTLYAHNEDYLQKQINGLQEQIDDLKKENTALKAIIGLEDFEKRETAADGQSKVIIKLEKDKSYTEIFNKIKEFVVTK